MDATAAEESKPAEPAGFTVMGTLIVKDEGAVFDHGTPCRIVGDSGYSDLRQGAPVTVYDASGTVIAIDELGPGTAVGGKDWFNDCAFDFRVEGVPAGLGIYSVEVSHRGRVNFTEEQAHEIELKIG